MIVVFTAPSLDDLDQIFEYVAKRFGFARAVQTDTELNARCEQLGVSPFIGHERPDIGEGARTVSIAPNVILYRIMDDDDTIEIVRIVDGRQNLERLLRKI